VIMMVTGRRALLRWSDAGRTRPIFSGVNPNVSWSAASAPIPVHSRIGQLPVRGIRLAFRADVFEE
jgi:hypothetical protein